MATQSTDWVAILTSNLFKAMALNTLLNNKINTAESPLNTTDDKMCHSLKGNYGTLLWIGALLTSIKDAILSGLSIVLPAGEQDLDSFTAVASGEIAAGSSSVTFLPSEDFVGTIDGIAYPGSAWQVVPFSAVPGKTLPAIPYTLTAGTLNIHKMV